MDPEANGNDYNLKCFMQCCSVKPPSGESKEWWGVAEGHYGDGYPVGYIDSVCFWPTSSEKARIHRVEMTITEGSPP